MPQAKKKVAIFYLITIQNYLDYSTKQSLSPTKSGILQWASHGQQVCQAEVMIQVTTNAVCAYSRYINIFDLKTVTSEQNFALK